MRDIKFRAWDKEDNRYLKPINTASMVLRFISGRVTDGATNCPYIELQQYTGLKDKNGVEIYEGDIVEFYMMGSYCDDLSNAVVEFKEGRFTNCAFWNGCNVIGNIYENPELLHPVTPN